MLEKHADDETTMSQQLWTEDSLYFLEQTFFMDVYNMQTMHV